VDEDQDALLTRRRLLAAGAVAAAGVALPAASASAKRSATVAKAATSARRYATRGYRRSRFEPHIGTPVELCPRGGVAVSGTLASIEDVPNVKGLAGDQDAYTLRLRAAAAQPLPAGIARLRHQHFGAVELYLTPVSANGLDQDYLAVINRRVPRNARHAPAGRRA
jgi:hypothetical protein